MSNVHNDWTNQGTKYTLAEQSTADCTLLNDKVWSINTNACTLSGDEGTRSHKWQWRLHIQTSSIHSALFSLLLTKRSFNLFTNCSPYKMPRTWPIWIKYTSKVLGQKQKTKTKNRTVFPSQSHALHWNCSKTQNTSSVFQFLSLSPQFIVLAVLHLKPCWLYDPGADSLTSLKILLGFGSSHGRLTKIKPD